MKTTCYSVCFSIKGKSSGFVWCFLRNEEHFWRMSVHIASNIAWNFKSIENSQFHCQCFHFGWYNHLCPTFQIDSIKWGFQMSCRGWLDTFRRRRTHRWTKNCTMNYDCIHSCLHMDTAADMHLETWPEIISRDLKR